jgi:hypothetical protein
MDLKVGRKRKRKITKYVFFGKLINVLKFLFS